MKTSLSRICPEIMYAVMLNKPYGAFFESDTPSNWVCLHVNKSYEARFELDVAVNCGYVSILARMPVSSSSCASKAFALLSTLSFDSGSVTTPLCPSWHAGRLKKDFKAAELPSSVEMD